MKEDLAVLDKIDRWHDGDGGDISLHEYLGWTWQEYKRWLTTGEQPNA